MTGRHRYRPPLLLAVTLMTAMLAITAVIIANPPAYEKYTPQCLTCTPPSWGWQVWYTTRWPYAEGNKP